MLSITKHLVKIITIYSYNLLDWTIKNLLNKFKKMKFYNETKTIKLNLF